MKAYLDLIIIGGAVLGVILFTAYQRHEGAVAERNKSAAKTTEVILEVQEVKNEIRNRPVSDSYTINRLRAGTF